jgi:predicted RNase H-like nuclease (RuvC/YqgF family)
MMVRLSDRYSKYIENVIKRCQKRLKMKLHEKTLTYHVKVPGINPQCQLKE